MKKILIISFLLLVFSCASAETLTTYRGTFSPRNPGYQEFCKEHPDVEIYWPDVYYYPSSAFITALLTKEFDCDLFIQNTDEADWDTLMAKGYCVDLSESKILAEAISQMHPKIAEQGKLNGHIYAIPSRIGFSFLCANEEAWQNMGFDEEEVPQSFSDLLIFLNAWCDRLENDPEPETVAFGGWEKVATTADYTIMLTELLVNEVTMQKQFAGEPLYFDGDELIGYLEQCREIGMRLSKLESKSYTSALFEKLSSYIWPESSKYIVYLRINEYEPKIIKARLHMWAVFAGSDQKELGIELLEKAAVGITDPSRFDDVFIYQNSEPRIKSDYESDMLYWEGKRNAVAKLLENMDIDGDTKVALEEDLERYSKTIEFTETNKWLISPDQLADYRQVANRLYFAPINVFDTSAEGYEKIRELLKPFGYEKENAAQLLYELNSVATMMRLEQ